MYDILSDKQRVMLVRASPPTVQSPEKIVELLEESEEWCEEWGESLHEVISVYDQGLKDLRSATRETNRISKKARRVE